MSTLAPEALHLTPRSDRSALLAVERDMSPADWGWLQERVRQDVAEIPRHLAPPEWVTFADEDGNFAGPGGTHDRITVESAWSADGGPVMWIDAVLHESEAVDPEAAVALAVDILRVATTVRPDLLAEALAQVIETLAPADVSAPSSGAAPTLPAARLVQDGRTAGSQTSACLPSPGHSDAPAATVGKPVVAGLKPAAATL